MSAASGLPRAPLAAFCALAVFSVVAIGASRLAGVEPVRAPRLAPVASVDLRFEDRADGSVRVTDASTGALLGELKPGTNAFVRMVVRGFARARQGVGLDDATPFRLERAPNSHLTLLDPATGRRVDLIAFGELNANAFGRLMPGAGGRT